ncbi:MAG TPA: 2-oxoacid:acceptor oxidoreductase subunit alpha [Acidobacteriota bacterium]|nr:2-oxoacid:acceptor oxidoreductase subunit alpha [Acidobacteriota bacterium]
MALDANQTRYLSRLEGKTYFLLGDEACAYGAMFAGCDFFAGYPITPASEIAEMIAEELPKSGGICVQMEDELASIAAIIGAAWTGARTMTATSGPGFSLMQENIGYAIMTETPCVIVNVQRSGPSTGQATKPAQGDVLQARWGTHGDHNIIALAPNSVQECLDLMLDCFDLADNYRTPVIMLMDGAIGHIRERVTMPQLATITHASRKMAAPGEDVFGGSDLVPGMIHYGAGQNIHVTGSTHLANGMRDVATPKVHDVLIKRIYAKIDKNRERIVRTELDVAQNSVARVGVLSYGATARPAYGAVKRARGEGKPIDFLRLITIWPFARQQVAEFAENFDTLLVPEMNLGQISREIERFVDCRVVSVPKIGGIPHTVGEILHAIREVA